MNALDKIDENDIVTAGDTGSVLGSSARVTPTNVEMSWRR
jgi:hypothetical protein